MGKYSRRNHQGVNYQRGGSFAWFTGLLSTFSLGRVDPNAPRGSLSRQLLRKGLRLETWSGFREAGKGKRQHNDDFGPMPRRLRRAIAGARFKMLWRERQRAPRVVPSADVGFRGLPPSFSEV